MLAFVAAAAAALAAHPAAPARLGVGATEYHFVLSRASVKAGEVVIEVQNQGQDVHDLRLRRIGATRTYSFPLTSPGARAERTLALRPGRYLFWCSVADHEKLGMRTVLRVRG